MEIELVQTHEAVKLGGKVETTFSSYPRYNRPASQLELLPDLMCVKVTSNNDCAIIPLVNVAYMHLKSERSEEKKEKAKKEAAKPKSNAKELKITKPR